MRVWCNPKANSGNFILGTAVTAHVQTTEAGKAWRLKVQLTDPDTTDYEPFLPIGSYR